MSYLLHLVIVMLQMSYLIRREIVRLQRSYLLRLVIVAPNDLFTTAGDRHAPAVVIYSFGASRCSKAELFTTLIGAPNELSTAGAVAPNELFTTW